MLLLKAITLITAISFGHRVQSPKLPGYDFDYLYETKVEGKNFNLSYFTERERDQNFRGFGIFVEPIKRATAKVVYETGPTGLDYQEFGYKERVFEERKILKYLGLSTTIKRRTLGWLEEPSVLTGVGLENKLIKISYGTNWMGGYTFRLNAGSKFAIAALGRGFWYMPGYYYERIDGGDPSFIVTNSIGFEWK